MSNPIITLKQGLIKNLQTMFAVIMATSLEIRIIVNESGRKTIYSGYYDEAHIAKAVDDIFPHYYSGSIYITVNKINSDLIARAANRLQKNPNNTTGDKDIESRYAFFIDIDPNRPSGVSSSDAEKKAAHDITYQIIDFLESLGWPRPTIIDSGNGYHLYYMIRLVNTDVSLDLIKDCLEVLHVLFSDEKVSIDRSVSNASRIAKLPGTKALKGDDTSDRPHRTSKILSVGDALLVSPIQLQELSLLLTPEDSAKNECVQSNSKNNSKSISGACSFDIRKFMEKHNINVHIEKPWHGGTISVLDKCPFDSNHERKSCIIVFANGAIAFKCQADSCCDKKLSMIA